MKKLTLKKETLRTLQDQELTQVAGGLTELCQAVTPLCGGVTLNCLTELCNMTRVCHTMLCITRWC